jgi:hypothetical protein
MLFLLLGYIGVKVSQVFLGQFSGIGKLILLKKKLLRLNTFSNLVQNRFRNTPKTKYPGYYGM